jgi:hypothetical protein
MARQKKIEQKVEKENLKLHQHGKLYNICVGIFASIYLILIVIYKFIKCMAPVMILFVANKQGLLEHNQTLYAILGVCALFGGIIYLVQHEMEI